MAATRLIFVSAVGAELRTSRELVAKTLRVIGCTPVWREFEPTCSVDLRPGLFAQIEQCSALIQIIGRCYGTEPPLEAQISGRTSYAQYEALSARQCQKPVWHFIIAEDFPTDSREAEPDSRRHLQEAYRNRVTNHATFARVVRTPRELEKQILGLRTQLFLLHRPAFVPGIGVAAFAIAVLTVGWWSWTGRRHDIPLPPVAPVVFTTPSVSPPPQTPTNSPRAGDSLVAKHESAVALRIEGKPAEAEKIFREVLAPRERLLGHEHSSVIDTCYELALALRDQGKVEEALIFAHRVDAGLNRSSTSDHPSPAEVQDLLTSLGEPISPRRLDR